MAYFNEENTVEQMLINATRMSLQHRQMNRPDTPPFIIYGK